MEKNQLYYGDNLEVLRQHIKDESVDLIYLDPPFNSRQDYNVLFAEKDGTRSSSQIMAFEDTWEWNVDAERAYEEIVERGDESPTPWTGGRRWGLLGLLVSAYNAPQFSKVKTEHLLSWSILMKIFLAAVILVTSSVFPSIAQQGLPAGYTFSTTSIPSKDSGAIANGVNRAGQIVGSTYVYPDMKREAFVRNGDRFTTFLYPGSSFSSASGINDAGQVIGYYTTQTDHGFSWSSTGGFSAIDVPGAQDTYPQGVNENGQVVGWYYDSQALQHGFLYSGSSFTSIDCFDVRLTPLSPFTFAAGINDTGEVVGSFSSGGTHQTTHGFSWNAGVCTRLPDFPGSVDSYPTGINDAGQIVGSYDMGTGSGVTGFLLSHGNFRQIVFPGASYTWPQGINNNGQIIGYYAVQPPQWMPFEANPPDYGTFGDNRREDCCEWGTLGSLVRKSGQFYILSNDHVLGLPTSPAHNSAEQGDRITIDQPMPDNSCPEVKHVGDFFEAPLLKSGVDAALASMTGMNQTGRILDIGVPAGSIALPTVNELVAKRGATTSLTCGQIKRVKCTATVTYSPCKGNQFGAEFGNLVMIEDVNGPFSLGGDSGSLIVGTNTAEPTALLFAGPQDGSYTLGIPINVVLDKNHLDAAIVGGPKHTVEACKASAPGKAAAVDAPLSNDEIARAVAAKEKYVDVIMHDPTVLAVCAGASNQEPSLGAVAIFVEKGQPHEPIPDQLDGVPTNVIYTEPFRAGVSRDCSAPGTDVGWQGMRR